MQGIVYIVRNPLEDINIYKVGCTSGDAENRIRTGQTWNSENLEIIREFEVEDCFAAEAAAHQALFNYRIREDREIFKCDVDILIGLVKDSISPWLSSGFNQPFNNDWLIDLIKEYHFCDQVNCGLCENKRKEFINELLIRATTNPVGLAPDDRVIHNQYTSFLIRNMQIGKTIEEALKKINPEKLLELNYWQEALNCLFSLDADKGFLSFRSDYPEDEMHERMRTRNFRYNEPLLIKVNGFNINQVIHYWSENFLSQYPDLLSYCIKVVKKKRENRDFGFVKGAIVAVSNAALNYFENLEQNNKWVDDDEYRLEEDYFKSLSFMKEIGSYLVEPYFPGLIADGEATDKHLEIKKKLNSLFLKRADFERKEKEETEKILREVKIDEKAADLSIPKEWAAILIEGGDDSGSLAYNYFFKKNINETISTTIYDASQLKKYKIENVKGFKSFNVLKYQNTNTLSRRYYIKNLDVILYARDKVCTLDEALSLIYIEKDKEFNLSQKKIQQERGKIKIEKELIATQRKDLLKKLWGIDSENAKKICENSLTVKKAISYVNPNFYDDKKILLKQRESIKILKHKSRSLKKLKKALRQSFGERGLGFLDLRISIDRKYRVLHIIRNNEEKIATLTHIDGYKLWLFDQFPFKENRRYDNVDDLILNCLNFKQDESVQNSPNTVEKRPIVENNSSSFRINFKTIFWVGAILFASSLLLN